MSIQELITKNRSYRRFYEDEKISVSQLKSWINLARLSPSARNIQSLRYKLVNDSFVNKQIFPLLKWAGYLKDWNGPVEGERPSAYIIVLNDENVSNNYYCDDGLATQSIMLGAVADGFGGCIIAAIDRPQLRQVLNIPEHYKIIHLLALGKPKETVVIEEISDNNIQYWRDKKHHHHVPKRKLNDLII